MATEPDKCLENLLRHMFMQGVRHGNGYPELAAIPIEESDIQFRAAWDDWHGNTWTADQWLDARAEKGLLRSTYCVRCKHEIHRVNGHWADEDDNSWCVGETSHEPSYRSRKIGT